jgi:hypothetical protein
MSAAHVSVRVAEDARLTWHSHVSATAGPSAWLYIGEGDATALWGSPAALRRLAAALVVAAEQADELIEPRRGGDSREGVRPDARGADEAMMRVVGGS